MKDEIVLSAERVETVWALVVASAHNGVTEGPRDTFPRHLSSVASVVGRLQGEGLSDLDLWDGKRRVARLDAVGCIRLTPE